MAIVDELSALRTSTLAAIEQAADTSALEEVRVAVLGKAGTLTGYLRGMGQGAKEERAAVGKAVNEVHGAVEAALDERKRALAAKELEAAIDAAAVDVTLPGRGQQVGTRHLINAITDQISEIFLGLGYTVAQGPEVETDYYNFEALNAPADHPSRSMQDTFYVVDRSGEESAVRGESKVLLRTQTSGVQVHVMEQQKPPIYMIAPGKVYRRARLLLQADVRPRSQDALPRPLLPVHRAFRRGRRQLRRVRRHGSSARRRALPHVQGHGLVGDLGLRHGRPQRA